MNVLGLIVWLDRVVVVDLPYRSAENVIVNTKPLQTNKYKPTSHHESNSFTCLELVMLAMTESTSKNGCL